MKTLLGGALALTLLAGGALAQATYVPGPPGGDSHYQGQTMQRGPGDGPVRDRSMGDQRSGDQRSGTSARDQRSGDQRYGDQHYGDLRSGDHGDRQYGDRQYGDRGGSDHRDWRDHRGHGYGHARRTCTWRSHHRRVCRVVY